MTSLTLQQARDRASVVSDVAYEIHLDLTRDDVFVATTAVTFTATPGASTFLDLQRAQEVRVTQDGRELGPECYRDDKVHLSDLAARSTVLVVAQLPYVTDGDGMHRFVDPADGEVYVGCYGGMDVNRRVFASFDQPDLKAPFTVSVTARPGATVLANGIPVDVTGDPTPTWTFSTTPPIATYLVTVCAGPWASRTWEHDGRPFGWHARASLADDLDRDLPDLREATETAYAYYAQRFTEPYPFDSYDQVLVPGHNWGAMETPGCVSYRDEMLPKGSTDASLRRGRAMTIAHEMAHMWFGNLVTFRWWEDTWLNESFADLLGFLVTGATGLAPGSLAEFDLGRKAGGYAADARPSTHPVAPRPEDVPDVDSAFNNFDAISYAKGNSCLRQLLTWLGDETFFAGVDRHLSAARFGTADLGDFVRALQSVTDRDVAGWVEAWLRRSGTDELEVEGGSGAGGLGAGGSGGNRVTLRGSRPHRLRVSGYAVGPRGLVRAFEEMVDLDPQAPVAELPAADVVVANSTGDTFVRVRPSDEVREALLAHLGRVPDEHARVIGWGTLLDQAVRGELPVDRLVAALEEHLPGESTGFVVNHVLRRTVAVVRQVAEPWSVPGLADRVAQVALGVLGGGAGEDEAVAQDVAVAQAATDAVLSTTHDVSLLRSWLAGDDGVPDLSQTQRWSAVLRLAELGEDVAGLVEQERRQDPSAAGDLAALSVGAAAPTAEAKREALARMSAPGVGNREIVALARGLWSAEQRDLVDPLVEDYLEAMVPVAQRGQALALVVGRSAPDVRWTAYQLAALEQILAQDDLPPALARTWGDVLHDQRLLGG